MDAPHVGGLGGTYGGNRVSCKAGLAVLDLLQGELLEEAVQLGDKVRARFVNLQEKYEIIGDVRGLGPMIAMELVKGKQGASWRRGSRTGEALLRELAHCYSLWPLP